ncbi:DUF4381 family protein [Alkalimonas amylolytica]|uniref:DUF4381 domain-containing protein n=1 Tax=Alkalimonas amylolytica TaxID=152573 RepID=A0A1H4C9W3_ALKAM|nr:DUF4381 family protein [Alkalimonas amylolytica]SEA57157.1 protein of unknown function [Alkalimonas amylolytica]
MTESHPLLAELADIIETDTAPAMGIAPGWWLVLLLALLAAAAVVWLAKRRRQQLQKQAGLLAARAEMQRLVALETIDPAAINQLLKRLIRHYAPNSPLLSCSTEEWQQFLQAQDTTLTWPDLNRLLYQPTPDSADVRHFSDCAKKWLDQQSIQQLQQVAQRQPLSGGADV